MRLIVLITVLAFAFSCKKPPSPPGTPEKYEQGILVLNEGLFEQNNASMSFYDGTEAFQQVFSSENDRGLGDTANDFATWSWGGREYIIVAVDVSSQIEIIDRNTLKTVVQIPMFDGTNSRAPRRVVVNGAKAFVCNFDGTVAVVDLITGSLITLIEVGANPDGMVVANDKLYVSNSGGLLYPVYDSTMSVINMETHTVETSFETRINSAQMVVDSQDEIYLISRGNYDDILPAMLRIETSSNTVLSTTEMNISSLTMVGDWCYYYNADESGIFRFNTLTESFDPVEVIDLSDYDTFYGLHYDADNDRFFCVDANGYVNSSTVTAYTTSGAFLFDFQAGLNATDIIFNN